MSKVLAICIALLCSVFLLPTFVLADDMAKEGWMLKLLDDTRGFTPRDDLKSSKGDVLKHSKRAGQGSRFRVVYVQPEDNGKAFIEFKRVKECHGEGAKLDSTYVQRDRIYYLDKSELNRTMVQFGQGWYAGALTLPFKYHPKTPTSPDALSSNLNVATVVGYSIGSRAGVTLTPMGFAGIENFALSGGGSDVEHQLGITWGAGFAFSVGRAAQIGAVVGGDHIAGSAGGAWPYQDRIWASISLGVKLLDI